MIKNHLKLAARNFWKFKTYSLINLVGMSLGLAVGTLILLFVLDELSFDSFHLKGDRIYKVVTSASDGGMETNAWPVAHKLKTEFGEVESVVYTRKVPSRMMINHEGKRYAHNNYYASEDFFNIFSFRFLEGEGSSALRDPYSLVITREIKEQYFGQAIALGRTLTVSDSLDFMITGVIENIPSQSHIQFDMLISFATYESFNDGFSYSEGWGNFNMRNYVLLKEGADFTSFQAKTANLYRDNIGDWMKELGVDFEVAYINLKDIYLGDRYSNGFGPKGSMDKVILVSAIGIFIILLACINFINMTTARSVARAREVGIRKIVGSSRWTVFWQFITESFFLTIASFLVVVITLIQTLPLFNHLMERTYTLAALLSWPMLVGITVLIICISLLAGYYPAIILSGLNTTEAIKGRMLNSKRGIQLRRILVIFQFAISAVLILGTMLIMNQLNFMRNQDLGFDKEQILVVDATNALSLPSVEVFRNRLKTLGSVESVAFTNALPGRPGWQGQWAYPDQVEEDKHVDTEYMAIDEHYIETLGLELIAGSNFELSRTSDLKEGLIINETAVEAMDWGTPANAIGKRIVSPSRHPEGTVIGVVRDYHGLGLQQKIWPKVMDYSSDQYGRFFAIRFVTGQTSLLLEQVRSSWKEIYSDHNFDYFFLDQEFDKQYRAEDQLMRVFVLFAVIGIVIACIGLLGMVSFMVNARLKEICIRKVHGASISLIAEMLSREFLVLVLISNILVIAPIWYFGRLWMQEFAYHTSLNPGFFVINLFIMLFLAFLTISIHTVKAANSNPATILRNE